jgi:hypothetical protein
MFKKKINGKKFIFIKGEVTKNNSDVLFNWTTGDLTAGDQNFIQLHREGGSVIYKECQGALAKFGISNEDGVKQIGVTQSVLTGAGILNYKKVAHIVLPNYRNKGEVNNIPGLIKASLVYAFTLLKEYGDQNDSPFRKVVLTPLPTSIVGQVDKGDIRDFFNTILSSAESANISEVKLIFSTEEEYELYLKTFTKEYISFGEKLYNKLFA